MLLCLQGLLLEMKVIKYKCVSYIMCFYGFCQVNATDRDSGRNGEIQLSDYSIITGSEAGLFSMCESALPPCVCVNQPLDYENKTLYHLLLKASDSKSICIKLYPFLCTRFSFDLLCWCLLLKG